MSANTHGRKRSWILGAGVVVAGLVVLSAQAWACTQIMGSMTISPTSGKGGTVVTTSAAGLKGSGAKYRLLFNDATRYATMGASCHSAPIVLKKGIRTSSTGSWSGVSVTIPRSAPQGPSELCGLETYPTAGQTGTTHQIFTVG